MKVRLLIILTVLLTFVACKEDQVSDDPTLRLSFSADTVAFDTVFTTMGSVTKQFLVYNRNANAVVISRIWLDDGEAFKVNVDGESDLDNASDWLLRGGDSLIVFVKVFIDVTDANSPVLVEDNLHFTVNQKEQSVHLEAYGQDVHLIKSKGRLTVRDSYTFEADKPYLIYDTVAVRKQMTFKPGSRLYFHNNALLLAYGDVDARGTIDEPIILRGDRIDRLYDSVPYAFVSGMWSGVYLMDEKAAPAKTYDFNYVEILSANVGLYCYSEKSENLPQLTLTNSRIHNHAVYGLVVQRMDALVVNSEISNAAAFCTYLSGGRHTFIHSTIAAYFNSTTVRIQPVPREDVAAVYINNVSKNNVPTDATFRNCIVSGVRRNNLVVATPLPKYYEDTISYNYLKADTVQTVAAFDNVYWQETDTIEVFRNTFYKYKEYIYYDFRLDSLSPARGIADPEIAKRYPYDREGKLRVQYTQTDTIKPDAGCYQY